MSICSSMNFLLNNISNEDLNIINVNISSGMQEEIFLHTKEVELQYIKGRDNPYYTYTKPEALKFNVTFAFNNTYTHDDLRKLGRILNIKKFIPLTFIDDSNDTSSIDKVYEEEIPTEIDISSESINITRSYYIMLDGDSNLTTNCIQQGYVTLSFICNSPYSYSQTFNSEVFDLSVNPTYTDITFYNLSDVELYPEINIVKIGNGDFSIINLSDDNREFKFTNLINNEVINVLNEEQIITTSLINTYRYSNFNDNYLKLLPYQSNTLRITGTAQFYFNFQYKFLV